MGGEWLVNPFELYVTYISWGSDGKHRPVLVIQIDNEEVSVYPITTQYEKKSGAIRKQYCIIAEWSKAGLSKQSYIDTGVLLCLPKSVLKGKEPIGKLTSKDKVRLLEFLYNKNY